MLFSDPVCVARFADARAEWVRFQVGAPLVAAAPAGGLRRWLARCSCRALGSLGGRLVALAARLEQGSLPPAPAAQAARR